MLKVSARADYAVRAMAEIARRQPEPVKARELADTLGVSYRFLAGILTDLARGGLLVSRRGGDGGYNLAVPPAEIDLRTLVVATEGSVWTVATEPPPDSPSSALWQDLGESLAASLASISVGDLVGAQPSAGHA